MQTRFNIGDNVYVTGEVTKITTDKEGTYYEIKVYGENAFHTIRLKENDEDLIEIPKKPIVSPLLDPDVKSNKLNS